MIASKIGVGLTEDIAARNRQGCMAGMQFQLFFQDDDRFGADCDALKLRYLR